MLIVGENYIQINCSRYGRYAYYPIWGKLDMGKEAKRLWYREDDLHNRVSFDEFKELFTQASKYFDKIDNPEAVWEDSLDKLFSQMEIEYRNVPDSYINLGVWR